MRNDVVGKLQIPAIGMIVGSALNALFGILVTISGILRLYKSEETLPLDDAERFGFLFGTLVSYGVGILSIVVAPVIFFGALKMMSGDKYKMAKTAAILSVLPVSCCFPLLIIFGIWALVVLSKPEVKAVFQNDARFGGFPPSPPQGF